MRLSELKTVSEVAQESFASIPEELRESDQWVNWRAQMRNGKVTKRPLSPHTGQLAGITDPATWTSFDEAAEALITSGFDGIGFVFTKGDPYVGIDLDNVIDDGQLVPWAKEIVDRLAPTAYIEVSPSGTGLHAIVRGRKPGPQCKRSFGDSAIEIYDQGRYFTVTGVQWLA